MTEIGISINYGKPKINCLTEIRRCGFNYSLRISNINNAKIKKIVKNLTFSFIYFLLSYYFIYKISPQTKKKKKISLFHSYLDKINSPLSLAMWIHIMMFIHSSFNQ